MNDWTLLIDFGTFSTKAAVADADGRIEPIELGDVSVTPPGIWAGPGGKLVVDAAAQVLRRVAAEAARHRRGKPVEVRLTCSPRWDPPRREALLSAARQAGLGARSTGSPPLLVDYPVAAALQLARAGRFGVGSRIALLGLGGGSAETSVLELTPEGVRVRALGGIEGAGGDQFDELLYRQMVGHAMTGWDTPQARKLWEPTEEPWRRAAAELFREVRRAKEELSQRHVVPLQLGPLIDNPLELSRIELEAVLRPLVLRTARELATTIELAGVRARQLDAILLTGGSSRIPLVARVIFDVIGVHPEVLEGPDLFLGAADWTPRTRLYPDATPITVAGGQTGEEAAAAAAAAAAALAATGAIDLLAIGDATGQPQRPVTPPPAVRAQVAVPTNQAHGVDPRSPNGRSSRRWPVFVAVAVVLALLGLLVNALVQSDDGDPAAASAGLASAPIRSTPIQSDPGRPDPAASPRPEARYGAVQQIADAWPAVVPVAPGRTGTAAPACKGSAAGVDHANGRIVCRYANGVRLTIFRYASIADRDRRAAELAARARVRAGTWNAAGPTGDQVSGRLLVADRTADGGPWRWWTYDRSTGYAMLASWPGHTSKELSGWWRPRAPFSA